MPKPVAPKKFSMMMPLTLHTSLKVEAAKRGTTMADLVAQLLVKELGR